MFDKVFSRLWVFCFEIFESSIEENKNNEKWNYTLFSLLFKVYMLVYIQTAVDFSGLLFVISVCHIFMTIASQFKVKFLENFPLFVKIFCSKIWHALMLFDWKYSSVMTEFCSFWKFSCLDFWWSICFGEKCCSSSSMVLVGRLQISHHAEFPGFSVFVYASRNTS